MTKEEQKKEKLSEKEWEKWYESSEILKADIQKCVLKLVERIGEEETKDFLKILQY